MHQAIVGRVDRHVPDVIFIREYDPRLNVIPALARMFVGLSFVPTLVAFAVISAGRVLALLAAHLGCLDALVDVVAGLAVGQQFIAGIALAIVAGRCVDAFMPALVQLDTSAFIHVAVQRFIALVGAIWFFVAHQLRVDAIAVRAHKVLRIRTRCILSSRC